MSKYASALTEDAAKPKEEGFGFLDVLDMINPLQHLPIVSTIYRNLTGDTIKPVAQVVGGAAFGGMDVTGAIAAVNGEITRALAGMEVADQAAIDARLIALDGTANRSRLGGNALVGGSNRTVALQPLSVTGQTGLNLAAGVASLELHAVH